MLIRKEEIKHSLLGNDLIVYVENPKNQQQQQKSSCN